MFALLCALASPAEAQVGRDEFGFTVSLTGGWYQTHPEENLSPTGTFNPRLGYSLSKRFHLELQSGYNQGVTRAFGNRYDAVSPRLDALIILAPDFRVEPFLAVGGGVYWARVNRNPDTWELEPLPDEDIGNYKNPDADALINAGPGVIVPIVGALSLRADVRWMFTVGTEPHGDRNDQFSNLEATVGFMFRGAERNRDKDLDGILDKVDECPDDPEDWDTYLDEDGCPDPDNDDDGIEDVVDDCPMDEEDFDRFEDRDGCPEDDNDRDGFVDWKDECPNEREDQDGFQDADGCPDRDNDDDGIADLGDRCPNHPEDKDGWEDQDGCEDPDNDSDGIPDVVDDCPNERELYNGFDDEDGCPDETPKEVERFTGVIRGINFEVDSSRITVDSYALLDEAAAVLIKYPTLRIEVQGHTDSDGGDDHNYKLSDARAESVVLYLINKGVDAERLTWMGYGESRPLVPNDSRASKAVNRRVEFHLVDQVEGVEVE